MSVEAEQFFALRCDFPDCGELFDDGEYTYWVDGPDAGAVDEAGWFADDEAAFCSRHVIEVACSPEAMSDDGDGGQYCQWCEDHATDTHLAPMPATWENRLRVVRDQVVRQAGYRLDALARHVNSNVEAIFRRTDAKLQATFKQACRGVDPTITDSALYHLANSTRRS